MGDRKMRKRYMPEHTGINMVDPAIIESLSDINDSLNNKNQQELISYMVISLEHLEKIMTDLTTQLKISNQISLGFIDDESVDGYSLDHKIRKANPKDPYRYRRAIIGQQLAI